jgi:hypothetical protein
VPFSTIPFVSAPDDSLAYAYSAALYAITGLPAGVNAATPWNQELIAAVAAGAAACRQPKIAAARSQGHQAATESKER